MKTSTIIFNVAGIVLLIGIFIALVDLIRHKAKSYGVTTQAPQAVVVQPAPQPAVVTAVPAVPVVQVPAIAAPSA